MTNLSDFSYVLCPGSRPDPNQADLYQKIYDCWRDVWTDAFKQLGVTKPLNSDAFTRQDLIGATFYKDQCIGMCFFRWTDATRPDFASDSYFQIWNDEHRKALCSRGNNIIVCSNLTLHPAGRGKSLGISGKDLIIGMGIQTYMYSQADAMTGAMRVDRGANEGTLRWGGTSIAKRVPCEFGADNTELVGFFRDDILKSPKHELEDFCQDLWVNRKTIARAGFDREFVNNPVETLRPLRVA